MKIKPEKITKTKKLAYYIGLFFTLYMCVSMSQAKGKVLGCYLDNQDDIETLNVFFRKYGKASQNANNGLFWEYWSNASSTTNNAHFLTLDLSANSTLDSTKEKEVKNIRTIVFYDSNSKTISNNNRLADSWSVILLENNKWMLEIASGKSDIKQISLMCNPDWQRNDGRDSDSEKGGNCAKPFDSGKQAQEVLDILNNSDSEADEEEERPKPSLKNEPQKSQKPVWVYKCEIEQKDKERLLTVLKSYNISKVSDKFNLAWVSDRDDNPLYLYLDLFTLSNQGSLDKARFTKMAAFVNTFKVPYSRPSKWSYVGGQQCRNLTDSWEFEYIEKGNWKLNITRDIHDYGPNDNLNNILLTCTATKNENKPAEPTTVIHIAPHLEKKGGEQ